jgi:hypothetical protein
MVSPWADAAQRHKKTTATERPGGFTICLSPDVLATTPPQRVSDSPVAFRSAFSFFLSIERLFSQKDAEAN